MGKLKVSKIFRVSSEYYDTAWYVRADEPTSAVKIIREYTEGLGWNLEKLPDEEIVWEVEEMFANDGEFCELRDM